MAGLTVFEKVAGRQFRVMAERVLATDLLECPDSAPCSPDVSFYRHPCSAVKGRTRSVGLKERVLTSPEMLVTTRGGTLAVISQLEAAALVASGQPVEYEVILAGKFSFTWKAGECGSCGLTVMSREGRFRDARPRQPEAEQRDLMAGPGRVVDREHAE